MEWHVANPAACAVALENIRILREEGVGVALKTAVSAETWPHIFDPIQEAKDLVVVLQAGALPAPLRPANEQLIGPTLGQDSVRKGAFAAFVGIMLVFWALSRLLGRITAAAVRRVPTASVQCPQPMQFHRQFQYRKIG